MNNVPIPVRKLCLTLQFDLSECDGKGASLPSKDHNLAIQTAAKDSGLFAPEAVVAKAVTVPGDVTIAAAQDVEFDVESASGEYDTRDPAAALRLLLPVRLTRSAQKIETRCNDILEICPTIYIVHFTCPLTRPFFC